MRIRAKLSWGCSLCLLALLSGAARADVPSPKKLLLDLNASMSAAIHWPQFMTRLVSVYQEPAPDPTLPEFDAAASEQATDRVLEDFKEDSPRLVPCCNMCPCTYGWVEGLILWRNNQSL